MTVTDPLAAFPDVANEEGDGGSDGDERDGDGPDRAETDRELLARHQRAVRNLEGVGVDGLVYEYRTQFHRDPLVAQDATAYYLAVRSHVWSEFADRMDLPADELARLKALHADQFAASVGESRGDGSESADSAEGEPMILTKE